MQNNFQQQPQQQFNMMQGQQQMGMPQQQQMFGQMQQMQPQQQQLGQQNPGKYKTQLCRHFKNGNCSLGNTCHFAHGPVEIRGFSDPVPQNIPQVQPKVNNVNNFKTVRCKYFDNNYCKNGTGCSFAHGDVDTRAQQQGGAQVLGALQQPQQQIDPNVQILIMILQNLEQVFPQNPDILAKLRKAQDFAKKQQTKDATQIILEIMEAPERTPQEKQSYQTIYQNAQVFFNTFMNKSNPQQQQQPQQ